MTFHQHLFYAAAVVLAAGLLLIWVCFGGRAAVRACRIIGLLDVLAGVVCGWPYAIAGGTVIVIVSLWTSRSLWTSTRGGASR